jgi:hypothetical protein
MFNVNAAESVSKSIHSTLEVEGYIFIDKELFSGL